MEKFIRLINLIGDHNFHKIQEVTDKLIENGKMQEISQKWFGDDLIAKKDEGENN